MKTLLAAEDLHVSYGSVEVLHGISLEVAQNSVIALLGANGAGKSTFINTVSGILPAKSGRILFRGEPLPRAAHRVAAKGIVQVPEGRRIFGPLTVEENLILGGYLQKDRARLRQNMQRLMQRFPILEQRRTQQAGTLSGGEQQMLAIARGLMAEPALLLLDEPSLGLSPGMVKDVFRMIEEIRSGGISIVLVEQNAAKALKVADYAYVLENGRITLQGPSAEIAQNDRVKKAYLAG